MEIHGDLNFFGGTFLENVNDDHDDDHDDEKSFLDALLSKLSERLKNGVRRKSYFQCSYNLVRLCYSFLPIDV